MKKLLFILVILAFADFSFPQDCFLVMKVKGEIVNERTGNTISSDDKICSNDKITFKSKDAAAMLYSSTDGKFTIKPDNKSKKEISGIISTYVSNALSKVQKQTNTKSLYFENDSKKSHLFNEISELYIIGQFQMFIICDDYSASSSIVAKYEYNGAMQTVNLKNTGSGYLIDKESVYTVNGVAVDQESIDAVSIYCNNKEMNRVILRFPDVEQLKNEISDYIKQLREQGKTDYEIYALVEEYFYAIYGNYEPDNFDKFLLDNFNIKKDLF